MKPIEAQTCVDAWLQACDHLLLCDQEDWRAYTMILEIAKPVALPESDRNVVTLVDRFFASRGGLPINSVVNTIFPALLYQRHGAVGLAERYLSEIYPTVRRHPDWQWGTYAQRLFQRIDDKGSDIKPLETLIKKLTTQLALQGPQRAVYELGTIEPLLDIPIYDPARDRTRPIGGPCLTHLSVKLTADRRVMLTGFYRSHFYIQRALGNLLGLAHLQNFIAKETGLEVGPLVCHSSMAQLELQPGKWGKTDVRGLIADAHAARQAAAA
jgi:hypothetical protein